VFNTVNLNPGSIDTSIANQSGSTFVSNPTFGQARSALGSRIVDMQARFSF